MGEEFEWDRVAQNVGSGEDNSGAMPQARKIPASVAARRARIAALISAQDICSQDELRVALAGEGIRVTQATLSRDLEALGAHKKSSQSGELKYVVDDRASWDTSIPGRDANVGRVLAETLLKVEASANIVVARTPPGAASYLAGVLDRSGAFEIVGTVAGDDTILAVTRSESAARELCSRLVDLSERSS